MSLAQWIVIAVALQRFAELMLSNHNINKLRAKGGIEIGASHYPLIVALHVSWLVALFFLSDSSAAVSWPLLSLFLLLQICRIWVIVSLGERWTTRIIIVKGERLIKRGPYRWFRHPNYLVVIGEILILPLVFGQWQIAVIFSLANILLIYWRIKIENLSLKTTAVR